LWDAGWPPVALSDQSPSDAGALTLAAGTPARAGAFTLPALAEGDEKRAATPPLDVEVTVTGEIPAELCESTDGYPSVRTTKVDCAPISLAVYALTVTHVCRNAGAPPTGPATDGKSEADAGSRDYPRCARSVTDTAAALDAKSSLRVGDAIAIRGVLAPGEEECTEMACAQWDGKHTRQRRVACCNGCGGWLLLRDRQDPRGVRERAGQGPIAAVQLPGQNRPLRWSAQDCAVGELLARSRPELVVSGVVRDWQFGEVAGISRSRTWLIDQARICTTGAWSKPQAAPPRPTDGPWLPSGEPLELEGPPAANPPRAP